MRETWSDQSRGCVLIHAAKCWSKSDLERHSRPLDSVNRSFFLSSSSVLTSIQHISADASLRAHLEIPYCEMSIDVNEMGMSDCALKKMMNSVYSSHLSSHDCWLRMAIKCGTWRVDWTPSLWMMSEEACGFAICYWAFCQYEQFIHKEK